MQINYGLAGLGTIAKTHLLGLRNLPLLNVPVKFTVDLKALYSTHPEENLEIAKSCGFSEVVDSMEKLVHIEDLDVVDICTPNFLHCQQASLAAQAGKHIYCEKPLANNSDETKLMTQEARKANIINQVAFVMRFNPAVAAAHTAIKQGVIGRPYAFRGELLHSSYLTAEKTMTWRLEKDKSGGGALADLGIHLIDLVRFLLGEIRSVSCVTDTIVKERKTFQGELQQVDVDDWASLNLQVEGSIRGTIEASRLAVGNDANRMWIYGDKGSLFIDLDHNPYSPIFHNEKGQRIYPDSQLLAQDPFYEKVLELYPNPKLSQGFMVDTHITSLLWFLSSVAQNSILEHTPTFEEGHRAQVVLDAAYQSSLQDGATAYVNL